jgi:hypothetical protein
MAIDFTLKDVLHKVTAKFTPAYLPDAKLPYNLRAVLQTELDVHGVASKAEVYNIEADPKMLEEGFMGMCELIYYLTADGYKIKTPLFNLRIRLPGEYEGAETGLNEGAYPEVRMQSAARFRKYIRERVQVQFDGIDHEDGIIAEVVDEYTGAMDVTATLGSLLTVRGFGLKLEGDDLHKTQVGLWFDDKHTPPVKAEAVAVNEPRTLKVIVPTTLYADGEYYLKIVTQSNVKGRGTLLKNTRETWTDFILTTQNPQP